ncbi:MAG: inositol monophosphatase family protein [Paracoccaceae bacterium]
MNHTPPRGSDPGLSDPLLTEPRLLEDLGHRLAAAGGAAALRHFRRAGLAADDKNPTGAFDPVTAADRDAEAAIRAVLAAERPDDAILGEEGETVAGTTGLTWIIDPIDGTRAFLAGLPTWGVLIALDDGARGRLGVIDQPFTGERFLATLTEAGPSAALWHRGVRRPLTPRPCRRLDEAVLMTTAPELFDIEERARFEAVRRRCRLTRYGTDCYAYALLALGQVDLVIEAGLHAYDIAAPAAIIRAAGGLVSDWRGGDCRWGGQVLAAGDPRIQAEALALLGL